MKIYLDNCCFNRPFDDQSQLKIHLETQAKLFIQDKIKSGVYKLIWSYILEYENSKNPFEEKKNAIAPWRNIACEFIKENEEILKYAESMVKRGIKAFDALHISTAVYAKCDYYIATDRKLLNTTASEIKIVNPIGFISEMEG